MRYDTRLWVKFKHDATRYGYECDYSSSTEELAPLPPSCLQIREDIVLHEALGHVILGHIVGHILGLPRRARVIRNVPPINQGRWASQVSLANVVHNVHLRVPQLEPRYAAHDHVRYRYLRWLGRLYCRQDATTLVASTSVLFASRLMVGGDLAFV